MKEFLRKNAKVIMTVMSIGLMFVFALPTFRNKSAEDVKGAPVGYLNGHKVTVTELGGFNGELSILRNLELLPGGRLPIPSYQFPQTSLAMLSVDEQDQPIYWHLLCTESERYAHSYISYEQAIQLTPYDKPTIEADLKAFQIGPDEFVALISKLDAVESYLNMVINIPQPVSQLELLGDRAFRKAQIAIGGLDAIAGWQQADNPTDEQIKAQFDAYKAVLATPLPREPRHLSDGQHIIDIVTDDKGITLHIKEWAGKSLYDGPWDIKALVAANVPTEAIRKAEGLAQPGALPKEINGHHYPFGYQFPVRARVEWIVLKKADVHKRIEPTEEDVKKAYAYFTDHPDKARGMVPSTTSAPASAPATMDNDALWKAVKDQLIEVQVNARVDAQMKRMLDQITTRAAAPWKNGTPDSAAWVPYAEIATQLAATPDFNGYLPEVGGTDRLLNIVELGDLPGIGDSFASVSQRLVPFRMLAVSLKDIVTLEKDNPLARVNLQKGAEGPPLRDAAGNIYIYRVIEADKVHDAAALTDVIKPGLTVKDQVIEDLKKLKTYENRVKAVKEAIAKAADFATLADDLKAKVRTPEPFSRRQAENRELPLEIAGVRGIVEKTFEMRESSDPAKSSIALLEGDDTLTCTLVRLMRYIESTGADFGASRGDLLNMPDPQVGFIQRSMFGSDMVLPGPFAQKYLDLEAVAGRIKYVPTADHPFSKKK